MDDLKSSWRIKCQLQFSTTNIWNRIRDYLRVMTIMQVWCEKTYQLFYVKQWPGKLLLGDTQFTLIEKSKEHVRTLNTICRFVALSCISRKKCGSVGIYWAGEWIKICIFSFINLSFKQDTSRDKNLELK